VNDCHLMKKQISFILNYINNGIIAIDRNGTVTICNTAAQKMLELDDNIIGRPIISVIPITKLIEVMNTGQSDYGIRFIFNNKVFLTNRTPILDHDHIIGSVAIFQDITELVEISDKLQYYEKINQELEVIIASSYDGICITDGEGCILKVNDAHQRVTNLTSDHFLGKKIDSLHEEGYFLSEPIAKVARKTKKIVTDIQVTKSGKEIMVTSSPVLNKNGEVIRVVTNARDMSEIISLKEQFSRSLELSNHLKSEFNKMLQGELHSNEMITCHPQMHNILELTRRVANSEVTVLLQGESGVGKEVFAKLIHIWSQRNGAFIKVNCSAIPGQLLESELFGYAPGAFTGAQKGGKPGLFELADEGTLFLDEIEDLPLELQGKFLRVLQDGEFIRLGGTKEIKVNVRLIAASNKELAQMVTEGRFRKDLYYRLNVVPILIPPLRERAEDIPLLVVHFLKKFNEKYNANKTISPGLLQKFINSSWPGNIRELKNTLERLVITSNSNIISDDVLALTKQTIAPCNQHPGAGGNCLPEPPDEKEFIPQLKEALAQTEKDLLIKALKNFNNSRSIGKALGISHTAVLKKIKKYNL